MAMLEKEGLDKSVFDTLRSQLEGTLIFPEDDTYETARSIWNSRIDCRPMAIVQASNAQDVIAAVNFARENKLPISVRGAGHHPCGYGTVDNGLMLDMRAMKGMEFDTDAMIVRAEPGLTTGELFYAAHEKGLIFTVGSHPTVGIAGLTLGGGLGVLMNKYGLTCDHLIAAEVVTADGQLRTANAHENSDLFWALRGGGGNFGVVTSLTLQLRPLEPIVAGLVAYPLERTAEVLNLFRDFTRDLPDETGALMAIVTMPNAPTMCALMAVHVGDTEEGLKRLAPLASLGGTMMEMIQPMPYTALLDMFQEDAPAGGRYSYSHRCLESLNDEAASVIAQYGTSLTSNETAIVLYHVHGAAHRVPQSESAFPARNVDFMLGVYAGWQGEDEPHLNWQQNFLNALKAHSLQTRYLNLDNDESAEAICGAYGESYARLQQVKHAYDPDNFFKRNANILPKAPGDAQV